MVVGRNFCNETVCVLYEKSFGNKQIILLLKNNLRLTFYLFGLSWNGKKNDIISFDVFNRIYSLVGDLSIIDIVVTTDLLLL